MEKDLDKLQEASRTYCLCEQLYDEHKPMISCDHCDDWFHWDCVGLVEPDDEDDEPALKEFRSGNYQSLESLLNLS